MGEGRLGLPGSGGCGERVGTCVEEIGRGVVLDSRLALVNRGAGWMALADIHYGYEVARRAGGGLFPLWGMVAVEDRVAELLDAYQPEKLVLVGDIVDGRAAGVEAGQWLRALAVRCEVVCVRGNHDRGVNWDGVEWVDFHREGGFVFHHGDRALGDLEGDGESGRRCGEEIEVIGHFHPALSLGDGAGTVLRLPALVTDETERGGRWVLPAFSPWAGGGRMELGAGARLFGCGRGRIIRRNGSGRGLPDGKLESRGFSRANGRNVNPPRRSDRETPAGEAD